MAMIFQHYHASPAAEEAPLRNEILFAYCDLLRARIRVAMAALNQQAGLGPWGECYATKDSEEVA